MRSFPQRITLAAFTVAVLGVTSGLAVTGARAASAGCSISYTVANQWNTGFTANVAITNLGDPLTSWSLVWSFAAGQQFSSGWNAVITQAGGQVTARNAAWNGSVATNGQVGFGFNGTWTGSNPRPSRSFSTASCAPARRVALPRRQVAPARRRARHPLAAPARSPVVSSGTPAGSSSVRTRMPPTIWCP
jgi:hypothetical protein